MLDIRSMNVIRYNNYLRKSYFAGKKNICKLYTMQCKNFYTKVYVYGISKLLSYIVKYESRRDLEISYKVKYVISNELTG